MSATHLAVVVLLGLGVALELLACAGVLAMRDAHDRLHYAAPASYGVALVAVAIVVQESLSIIGDKALLTAAVVILTAPVLTHVTGRSLRVAARGRWQSGSERSR